MTTKISHQNILLPDSKGVLLVVDVTVDVDAIELTEPELCSLR